MNPRLAVWVVNGLLAALAAFSLFPLLWMLSASFMPHGWVASDYVRAVLDLFAYERETDNALVVAGGVPASWLRGTGIEVKELRTQHGPLSYSMRFGLVHVNFETQERVLKDSARFYTEVIASRGAALGATAE